MTLDQSSTQSSKQSSKQSSTNLASAKPAIVIPSIRTVLNLVIGGFAGLGAWELFPVLAVMITGEGLSPPWLVKFLFARVLGIEFANVGTWPTLLHIMTGALFYPLGYFILTRWIHSFGKTADAIIWGILTTFLALGIFAPLAGLPFLLLPQGFGPVTFSLLGHVVYAVLAALLFEHLEASNRR